jgi:hypothetical protein
LGRPNNWWGNWQPLCPAKVIFGTSTVEGADDGQVLKLAILYGLVIVLIISLVTFVAVRF